MVLQKAVSFRIGSWFHMIFLHGSLARDDKLYFTFNIFFRVLLAVFQLGDRKQALLHIYGLYKIRRNTYCIHLQSNA